LEELKKNPDTVPSVFSYKLSYLFVGKDWSENYYSQEKNNLQDPSTPWSSCQERKASQVNNKNGTVGQTACNLCQ
jgi:hypothetical protein